MIQHLDVFFENFPSLTCSSKRCFWFMFWFPSRSFNHSPGVKRIASPVSSGCESVLSCSPNESISMSDMFSSISQKMASFNIYPDIPKESTAPQPYRLTLNVISSKQEDC